MDVKLGPVSMWLTSLQYGNTSLIIDKGSKVTYANINEAADVRPGNEAT